MSIAQPDTSAEAHSGGTRVGQGDAANRSWRTAVMRLAIMRPGAARAVVARRRVARPRVARVHTGPAQEHEGRAGGEDQRPGDDDGKRLEGPEILRLKARVEREARHALALPAGPARELGHRVSRAKVDALVTSLLDARDGRSGQRSGSTRSARLSCSWASS